MKPTSRGAVFFSLLAAAAVIVSIFVAPGCTTWRTKKYGDAKLKRENYHFRNIRIGMVPEYREFVSFPEVKLDTPATNVFPVRNFPSNSFIHDFTLDLPKKTFTTSEPLKEVLPWQRSRIRIIARDLDGHEFFSQQIALNKLPQWWGDRYDPKPSRTWWNQSWHIAALEDALMGRTDYDLIVVIEEPSSEKGNTIQIHGSSAGHFTPWRPL
jgi:hypothetical protein